MNAGQHHRERTSAEVVFFLSRGVYFLSWGRVSELVVACGLGGEGGGLVCLNELM